MARLQIVATEKAKLNAERKEVLVWLKLANEHVRALESQPTVAALSVESASTITSSLTHKLFVFFTFLPLVCGADAWGRNIWRRSLRRSVAQYCRNEVDYRRSMILAHFNERFDQHLCPKGCDKCAKGGMIVRQQYTSEAQQAIRLFEQMAASMDRIPFGHFIRCVCGS